MLGDLLHKLLLLNIRLTFSFFLSFLFADLEANVKFQIGYIADIGIDHQLDAHLS